MAVPAPQKAPLLDSIEILKEAWEHFSRQWQAWVILSLCYLALATVLSLTCVGLIFMGTVHAGLYVAAFKQLRGQVPEARDVVAGFTWVGPTTVATLLVGICVFLGFLLCIIPGLILAVWWTFAIPLCVSHGLSATDAMAMSKQKVKEGFWDIVVFLLVIFAVNIVTSMVPFCQLLVGFPLQTLMIAIAHRNLFGLEGALPPLQKAPPAVYQPAAPPAGPVIACRRCNAVNAAGTRFCTACGAPLA